MKSIYYSAAWTDSGFLLGCSHEHETIVEADSCIPCAGGYVVGVENGVMRSLTTDEEAEFQRVHYAPRSDKPAVETTLAAPTEGAFDPRYAIMTPIWVVDHWTWATWMCFDTYAQALAHARRGSKECVFESPEWAALKQQEWAAAAADGSCLSTRFPRDPGEHASARRRGNICRICDPSLRRIRPRSARGTCS